ncbi:hypothetical protein [Leminorella grimontii]|uniref:hypothetical protein n=1 Tax=Leminorella grimontii TaxID=82981 RepID=UPI00208A0626|nr:hypothetical protein [Leminorella grimontii]GKX58668.1 hypothetical protein SOASR031_09830 [Leminorella grimontii]
MDIESESYYFDLLSVNYEKSTDIINYCFNVNGEVKNFSAKPFDVKGIRGISYTDGLDELLMSVMPLQPKISRILGYLTWDLIDGRDVALPVRLIP